MKHLKEMAKTLLTAYITYIMPRCPSADSSMMLWDPLDHLIDIEYRYVDLQHQGFAAENWPNLLISNY
jgi:hypothetical protein